MHLFDSNVKNILILFIKTLSIYAILSVFFYCYVGLVDPVGDYYASFLAEYSLIKFILNALIYPIRWILELFGYDVVNNNNNVSIANEKGILIYHACLGIDIMIAYVSLVLGYPGRKKILFLIIGLFFVHVLNIVRMLMIILMIKTNPHIVTLSHDVFNLVGYLFIIAFYIFYVNRYSSSIK